MAKAFSYLMNPWQALFYFSTDGKAEIKSLLKWLRYSNSAI